MSHGGYYIDEYGARTWDIPGAEPWRRQAPSGGYEQPVRHLQPQVPVKPSFVYAPLGVSMPEPTRVKSGPPQAPALSDEELTRRSKWYTLYGLSIPSRFSSEGVDYAPLIPVAVYVCRTTVVDSRIDPSVTEFRRRIAKVAGFTHIELSFRFAKSDTGTAHDMHWSVSSTVGKAVHVLERDITGDAYNPVRGEWQLTELRLTQAQRQRAWVFSQDQIGKPYNTWGVYAFANKLYEWLPDMRCLLSCLCTGVSDGSRYFCSQLILDTLAFMFYDDPVRLGIIRSIEAYRATPGDAMDIITKLDIMSTIVSSLVQEDAMIDALNRQLNTEDELLMRREKGS